MSVAINNLINFSRSLPAPFDTLTSKKVKVSSKYGSGTEATLSATVIKAVHAVCDCMSGIGEGALGVIDHRMVVEYKSSSGPDAYHLVVYDSATGNIVASGYDKNTEMIENYRLHQTANDGAAVLMAMIPALMADQEFEDNFNFYHDQRKAGYSDMSKATEYMAILCDNAYRRIKDETCPANIKAKVEKSGNVLRVSQAQLDSGAYTPSTVMAGEFTIFAKTAKVTVSAATTQILHTDFEGKYQLTPGRKLSVLEESLVPRLEDWYIIPEQAVNICRHAQMTTGKPMQMRNFLMRGPAGTGKTQGARAIAAGLHLPYMKYTCSASTEVFDFVGMVFPKTDTMTTGDAQLDKEREMIMGMGGINYTNVAKIMNLPDLEDMDFDPCGVFQNLTGIVNDEVTSRDCMAVVMDMVAEKIKALSKPAEGEQSSGQTYTYVETDFIKALKNGYLLEIQEPTVIMQPGVLVGLNSLLEQGGSITLPTGEVIQRHPDTVIVVTTNVTYEGCRGLNQSVVDRMSLVEDIELPSPEVMVQRAMAVTGATDEYQVSQMVQVVNDMSDYMRKNNITDGSCGMRSLIDWITSAEITGDVYRSAISTIISKASSDEDDREALKTTVLEPIFAPSRKKAS